MSKIVQKGASAAMRVRSMSSLAEKKISPEKLAEWGQKVNPAQTQYGPVDPKVAKWQKFFQDPLNVEKPVFIRKGVADELIVSGLTVSVVGIFIYNCYVFCTD